MTEIEASQDLARRLYCSLDGGTFSFMSKDRLARLCFAITFAIAGFSFGLQFVQDWLGVWDEPGLAPPSHAVRAWQYFSYFTTQANLLVIATSLSLARRPDRDGSGWRIARLDALTGITITGLVHWFLLHPLDHFRGWLWASDTLVHIVVPTLVVLGWLVFGPRRRISITGCSVRADLARRVAHLHPCGWCDDRLVSLFLPRCQREWRRDRSRLLRGDLDLATCGFMPVLAR